MPTLFFCLHKGFFFIKSVRFQGKIPGLDHKNPRVYVQHTQISKVAKIQSQPSRSMASRSHGTSLELVRVAPLEETPRNLLWMKSYPPLFGDYNNPIIVTPYEPISIHGMSCRGFER